MAHAEQPEIRLDPAEQRLPPPRRHGIVPVLAGVVLGLAGLAGWLWWSQQAPPPEVAQAPPATSPADSQQASGDAPEDLVQYPVAPPDDRPLRAEEVQSALTQLLGREGAARYVQTEDFPRRFVATLDGLGRAHVAPLVWPVAPAPGRFTVEEGAEGSMVIATGNAQRYVPFVDFASSVDSAAAVQLYLRMYPLLDEAWRHLGMGKRHLNDRLVAVIDQLLATPEPRQPVAVKLVDVKGPVASTRPWVRYEFADPELEALTAGQKMLVRMGPANERRLKQKLKEIRAELVRSPPDTTATR